MSLICSRERTSDGDEGDEGASSDVGEEEAWFVVVDKDLLEPACSAEFVSRPYQSEELSNRGPCGDKDVKYKTRPAKRKAPKKTPIPGRVFKERKKPFRRQDVRS
jgi:hypothetical protein